MRSLLNKVFTPRAIQAYRQLVTDLIDKHLCAVDPAGFDFVQDFSALFPVDVVTTHAGRARADRQQIRLWIDALLHREAGEVDMSEDGQKAAVDMAIYYFRLIKKRRNDLGDDLLSKLIQAEMERDDGEMTPLDNIEITEFATLLGGAGAETVTKLLGSAAVVFAHNPDQWQKLLDDRSKIGAAVEELLRYEAPAQYNVRCSLREITLHGVTIPAEKPVFLVGGSANRDPLAWTDPDRFDVDRDRTQSQNLGLGYGIHSCLGAALARMETAIALDKMLDFMPRYEVEWDGCRAGEHAERRRVEPRTGPIVNGELKIDRGIPSQLDRVADQARAHERAGYDGCWTGEINHDPFLPLLLAAEHTTRSLWAPVSPWRSRAIR